MILIFVEIERARSLEAWKSYQISKVNESSEIFLNTVKSEKGLFLSQKMVDPYISPLAFKFSNPGGYITYLMILYLPWGSSSQSLMDLYAILSPVQHNYLTTLFGNIFWCHNFLRGRVHTGRDLWSWRVDGLFFGKYYFRCVSFR